MSAIPDYGAEGQEFEDPVKEVEDPVISHKGGLYPTMWEVLVPYFSEFVGCFTLMVTFLGTSSQMSKVRPETLATETLATSANGFMVCALVYALVCTSGAHLNPSVTISLTLTGRLPMRTARNLILSQIGGASTAALILSIITSDFTAEIGPLNGYSWAQVVSLEILYTAMLCFVYLNCVASLNNNPVFQQNGFSGLAVGFVFVAAGLAMQGVTHAVMNSAIAVALSIVDNLQLSGQPFRAQGLIYFTSDIVGAVIGTGLYRVVRPEEIHLLAARRQVFNPTMVAAEFIGTFFVIFTKVLNRLTLTEVNLSKIGREHWSVMAATISMAYSLRGVSGSYFNPALTIAAKAAQQGEWAGQAWVFYLIVQVFAGIVVSAIFAALSGGRRIPSAPNSFSMGTELCCEAVFAAFLTYVVLSTRTSMNSDARDQRSRQNNFHGLAYGAVFVVAGFTIGPITGAMLNPIVVVSFVGVDILRGQMEWGQTLFILYQVTGAMCGAAIFMLLNAELYRTGRLEGEEEIIEKSPAKSRSSSWSPSAATSMKVYMP